jgi:hypothetical protein
MQFPNRIQAALLFDRRIDGLEAIVRAFMLVEEARSGARFNVPEARPGAFYCLFGGDDLMITLEYIDRPADAEVFRQTLSSAITGILCPDMRQRVTTNRSHILINVSHGVLGDAPEVRRLLQQIDYPLEGHSLAQFTRRLEICALISRIACDHAPAQAVHWTQSNQLFPGEKFDDGAELAAPSPLHVHPFLFGGTKDAGGATKVGIRTFGARHFIGREVIIEPSVLPWAANFETILTFIRVAMVPGGYVIPDGDCFGPEDRSLSYRVLHRPAADDEVPLCELVPLLHRKFDFVSDEYVPPERVFDDRAPPSDLMPESQDEKMVLANEWREKRALAEGIGGRFEVRARGQQPGSPTNPPAGSLPTGGPGLGARPIFGRKQAGR